MQEIHAKPVSRKVRFKQEGFLILPDVFDEQEIERLVDAISSIDHQRGARTRTGVYAVRNLLEVSPVIDALATSAKIRAIVEENLDADAFPVRGTLFDKTAGANWLVPWHQDLTICVVNRMDVPGYGPWTTKAGVWNVQPPVSVLERMLAVRIHLDDCHEDNGALRVLPGTHTLGRLNAEDIAERRAGISVSCAVNAGGVVLMKPLLLHASSAAARAAHRRVIHIEYAASQLAGGLQWRTTDGRTSLPPTSAKRGKR